MKHWIILLAGLASIGVAPVRTAFAQSDAYPVRPVRVVVPFPPGGSVDTVARLVAPRLSESFGQQFVIENRSGASGNIGAEQVARAAADVARGLVAGLPARPVVRLLLEHWTPVYAVTV